MYVVCEMLQEKYGVLRLYYNKNKNEMLLIQIVFEGGFINGCFKYNYEMIQMYCYDYEQLCCGLCVGIEYRKCEKVDIVENVV